MSKRLEILKASLEKKQAILNERFATHFADVKQANGQPMNDKRNGRQTFSRWDKQEDAIRNAQKELEKTKEAIRFEEDKIRNCELVKEELPAQITDLLSSGTLVQWRKHPNTFFVEGVDKARIVWLPKTGEVAHKYTKSVTNQYQWKKFADVYNSLHNALKK